MSQIITERIYQFTNDNGLTLDLICTVEVQNGILVFKEIKRPDGNLAKAKFVKGGERVYITYTKQRWFFDMDS